MSTPMSRPKAAEPGSKEESSAQLIQRLLRERRDLLVTVERLRIELAESQASDKRNPRIHQLESDVSRLQHELGVLRAEHEDLLNRIRSLVARVQSEGLQRISKA
jgi:predicted nuclease with TOPRIM domain